VRIAVHDLYWETCGGGEQFAGGIAQTLAPAHEVTLLTPKSIDLSRLGERLHLDLSGCRQQIVRNDVDATRATAEFDLFFNCTYLSTLTNLARAGVFVTHFPGVPRERTQSWRQSALVRLPARRPFAVNIDGLYEPEQAGGRVWTNGLATVAFWSGRKGHWAMNVSAEHIVPGTSSSVRVSSGRDVLLDRLIHHGEMITIDWPSSVGPPDRPQVLVIESDVFSPRIAFGAPDPRTLGLQLRDLRLDEQPVGFGPGRVPVPQPIGAHLDSYDVIAANSEFTAAWTKRLMGRSSVVLYPPVTLRAPGTKRSIIVSVGRFFAAQSGHSKKQLEMIAAFRQLHERGLADGWELHLVGGCSGKDREYGVACRAAARGLPVVLHFNAPGRHLDALLAEASVYWHAAGFGEDADRHPDRFEHFGISVVEAMSAGCVPVVFGAAGPAEVVRDGIDGRHFSSIDQLVSITAALIVDPTERERLGCAAEARSQTFGPSLFEERLMAVVDGAMVQATGRHVPGAHTWGREGESAAPGCVLPMGVTCNVCGWRGSEFAGPVHVECLPCSRCGAIVRDRFLHEVIRVVHPWRPGHRLVETSPRLGTEYRQAMGASWDYLAIDFDRSAHSAAVATDIQAMALAASSVDVFATSHVLEHVPDTAAALAEVYRVLRPGGHLVLLVPIQQGRTGVPAEPEYHGDRTLVYHRFGFDLHDRVVAAGFDDVRILTVDGFVADADLRRGDGSEFDMTSIADEARNWPIAAAVTADRAHRIGLAPASQLVAFVGLR
jgi:glycosyltransferase involved in cell wall biosynthesis/SAM-dependent methyltransferase